MSIRSKIILLLVILITLPTAFLGYRNYNYANDILAKELKVTATQVVNKSIESMDFFLSSLERDAAVLSSNDATEHILEDESRVAEMFNAFEAYINANAHVMHAYAGTKEKQMYIYPDVHLEEGFDPTIRPWYQDAFNKKQIIWTDPYVDKGTGTLVISVASPIYNTERNNEFVGVLALDISLDKLTELVNDIRIGQTGFASLVNQEGKFLIHNDYPFDTPIPVENLKDAVIANESDLVEYKVDGDPRFAYFATIPQTGWRLIGTLRYEELAENTESILKSTMQNGAIGLAVAIIIGFLFSGIITKPLKLLAEDMKRIGSGDFTIRTQVKSKDEVGSVALSLNQMIQQLGSLIGTIQSITTEVSHAADTLAATSEETSASSEEVTRTVEEIARGASDQAAEAEKGASMTNRLSGKFVELNNNSNEMHEISGMVADANKKGVAVVEGLISETEENIESITRIEQAISNLDSKAQSIGVILNTISEIAEQTNLLALNAAIEAARAGEAGRGFAVVADEIRKLAEQSGKSTDEISKIILDIQSESNNTVQIMSEVKKQTNEQTDAVKDVSNTFENISSAISTITGKIDDINTYVEEMTKDGNEIVAVIENISAVSEETAAASQQVTASMEQTSSAVEEVARAAEELNMLADKLAAEIQQFKI